MHHKYHTQGIVLGGFDSGDSSKRVAIFTRDSGLVYASVQNARSINSKLRYGMQDFTLGNYSLIKGRHTWKLVSAEEVENFYESLRYSPAKLRIMNNVLNLVRRLVSGEEANIELFDIVSSFLHFLLDAKEEDIALAECLVLLRMLHNLGFLRHDPEFVLHLSSTTISPEFLENLAPKKMRMVTLINESLKEAEA